MTTRKERIYLVRLGDTVKLVRANGVSRAIQTVAKDFMQARVAEPDDLIRIANAAGAQLEVVTPAPRGEWVAGRPGRPPRSASAAATASAEPASSDPSIAAAA
jgi:hypothetical protein